jgi:transcription initiation factor TFIIIB Brf1 subunit/transcription initiation factor TFIIB
MNERLTAKEKVEPLTLDILDSLESSGDVRLMTSRLLKIADKYSSLESKNPLGEAAGIVYIAGILADQPVTLVVIAEKSGISPETVRKYKTHLASSLKTKKEWPGLLKSRR